MIINDDSSSYFPAAFLLPTSTQRLDHLEWLTAVNMFVSFTLAIRYCGLQFVRNLRLGKTPLYFPRYCPVDVWLSQLEATQFRRAMERFYTPYLPTRAARVKTNISNGS